MDHHVCTDARSRAGCWLAAPAELIAPESQMFPATAGRLIMVLLTARSRRGRSPACAAELIGRRNHVRKAIVIGHIGAFFILLRRYHERVVGSLWMRVITDGVITTRARVECGCE